MKIHLWNWMNLENELNECFRNLAKDLDENGNPLFNINQYKKIC